MSPLLFSPLKIGAVTVPNRIAVAPMCQYSASDGTVNEWHLQHWMTMGMSGSGLVMIEATGVERIGRITHGCVGLYNDLNEREMSRTLNSAKAVALPGTVFGIQLGHARLAAKGMIHGRRCLRAPSLSTMAGPPRRCWTTRGLPESFKRLPMQRCVRCVLETPSSKCT